MTLEYSLNFKRPQNILGNSECFAALIFWFFFIKKKEQNVLREGCDGLLRRGAPRNNSAFKSGSLLLSVKLLRNRVIASPRVPTL